MKSEAALLREFDQLVDAVEAAHTTWELADWLAEHVPNHGRGRPVNPPRDGFTLKDLAARSGLGVQWLTTLRAVADQTREERLDGVSVRAYKEALNGRTLADANALLRKKGYRLRDVAGPMESPEAMHANLEKLPPEQQAAFIADHLRGADPAVVDATAAGLAGTKAGGKISAINDLLTTHKAAKEAQDKGEEPFAKKYERQQFYQVIGDETTRIWMASWAIADEVKQFSGDHDPERLARSVQLLEAAERLCRETRELLLGIANIDLDSFMQDLQTHLNAVE